MVGVHFVLDWRRTTATDGRPGRLRRAASRLLVQLQRRAAHQSASRVGDALFDGRRYAGPARVDHRQRYAATSVVIRVRRLLQVVLLERVVLLVAAGVHLVLNEPVDVAQLEVLLADAAYEDVLLSLASIRVP